MNLSVIGAEKEKGQEKRTALAVRKYAFSDE